MTILAACLNWVRRVTRKAARTPAWAARSIATLYRRAIHQLVLVLTEQYWLIDYLPKQKAGSEALLLVRLDLIGDFIIWLDAAKEFKKLYPDKRIVLYANSAWAALAKHLTYWDEVVSVDMTQLRGDDLYRFKLLCGVHLRGFVITIQPTYSREYVSDLLVRASKARQRIGHLGDANNISLENKLITDTWYTVLVPQGIQPEVELNINAQLIRALGHANFKSRMPHLASLTELPVELKIGEKYCVLVPGASWGPKMWPIANFAELAVKITQQLGLKIILCGTQAERSICSQVAELSGVSISNLAGQTTLVQMIEIIRHASLLIANDSASIHIAAATRTPSVCILGGGHFGRFLPYQPEVKDTNHASPEVMFHEMDCYGCRWKCQYSLSLGESAPCVSGVGVSQVMKACMSFVKREKGPECLSDQRQSNVGLRSI
jgi:ADP-heptose:LPS heptosyltransferase